MNTILKGSTSGLIEIQLAPGFDYSGKTVHVNYQGVTRAFTDCVAGGKVELSFGAKETAPMALGVWPIDIWITDEGGTVIRVASTESRIRVTDVPSEVYTSGVIGIAAKGVLAGIEDLPERYTDADVVAKLREILRAGGAAVRTILVCATLLGASLLNAATVQTAPKQAIFNDQPVVTNVTFEGLATLEDLKDAGVSAEAVTNIVKAVAPKPEDYTTTNAVKDIIKAEVVIGFSPWEFNCDLSEYGMELKYQESTEEWYLTNGEENSFVRSGANLTHMEWDGDAEDGFWGLYTIIADRHPITKNELGIAMVEDLPDVAPLNREIAKKADASTVNSLSNTVTQWTTYWDGDDVRVTITNYYGSMALPSMYLEQRMPADETHDATWFKVVWNELTRWNDFLGGYSSVTNELAQKADRAWGFYDSATGEYSPEDFLQISTPHVILANGMAYQKTVTTGGCSMWVLTATQPTTLTGETEQGFFRIQDGDGNALFEIVKGDKRVVGATASALTMAGGAMRITYPVNGDQPTLSVCTDLRAADWQTGEDITVATVAWSGGSGNWVATVTPVGPRPSLFCKASYEVGGNTYIKNNVATSIDKVVVGGHEYTVTVETVNGKKLLVLQ